VLKESLLDVNISNLAIDKEKGGIGIIPILDSCIAASLTCVCHKWVHITSRLFTERTCSVVWYYPDADQSAWHSLEMRRSCPLELKTKIASTRYHSESLLDPM
jgi:hypothetical protein